MENEFDDSECTRPPVMRDLVEICRELNARDANYIVVGVTIPFAWPKLLWLTKQTFREKDAWDRVFLKKLLIDRGEWPVEGV